MGQNTQPQQFKGGKIYFDLVRRLQGPCLFLKSPAEQQATWQSIVLTWVGGCGEVWHYTALSKAVFDSPSLRFLTCKTTCESQMEPGVLGPSQACKRTSLLPDPTLSSVSGRSNPRALSLLMVPLCCPWACVVLGDTPAFPAPAPAPGDAYLASPAGPHPHRTLPKAKEVAPSPDV